MKNLFIKTIKYFFPFYLLSGVLVIPLSGNEASKFDSITNEIEACVFSRATRAKTLMTELQSISKNHPDNMSFAVQTLLWEARINCLHDVSDSALTAKVLTAANTWNLSGYPLEQALLGNTLALCHLADGNYTGAFSIALQALEQLQQLSNTSSFMTKILYLLGNICLKTQNMKMAIDYYKQAFAFAVPGQREYYSIRLVLYTYMADMDRRGDFSDSLLAFVPVLEQLQDTSLLITAYFNMGTLFVNMGETDKGYDYYLLSRD